MLSWLRSGAARLRGAAKVVAPMGEAPMSLARRFREQVQARPDARQLWFEGRSFTFGEMERHINRRAFVLRDLGVRAGDAVGVMMANRPSFVINVLALSRLGATPALLNDSLVGASLRHAASVTEPRLLVVGHEHGPAVAEAFEELPRFGVVVDSSLDESADPEGTGRQAILDRFASSDLNDLDRGASVDELVPTAVCSPTDLGAYIYTSGTTGLPKAGRIPNGRIMMAARGMGGFALGLHADDVLFCPLPLFHASGLMIAFGSSLDAGCTLALARKFSTHRFWDDVDASGATAFVYIGEICRYLLSSPPHPKERSHRLRCCIGNGLREEVWAGFEQRFAPGRIVEFYGSTEGNVNMVNYLGKRGSCGRMPPLPHLDNTLVVQFDHETQMPARDASGRCIPCGADEPGELLGRIDPRLVTARFDGYVGQKETEAKILRDVRKPGDMYFRSGDLLRRDRWGFFYFVDRIGDTFRWKGHNVSTNEVMDAIVRFAGIRIANVYGVEVDGHDGRAGMAAVVLEDGSAATSPIDGKALYQHLHHELPPYAAPLFLRVVDAADLTVTFKLKKTDLVRDAYDRSRVTDPMYVRDDAAAAYIPYDDDAVRRIDAGGLRL